MFLPAGEMRKALHGDRAAVRVAGRDHRGRPDGEIVEVLERAQPRASSAACTPSTACCFLVPEDRRIAHDILVPPAEAGRAKPGQVVTVEIVAQPSKHAQPIGRVVEVLGNYADPGMEIEIALRKYDLPHEFSKKAMAQATRSARCASATRTCKSRRTCASCRFVTIDGETAQGLRRRGVLRREGARAGGCGWRSPTSATTCATATRSTATRASAAPRSTSRGA